MQLRFVLAALLALPVCLSAHADTFVSFVLESDNRQLLGIDAEGDVLFNYPDAAIAPDGEFAPDGLYYLYHDGLLVSITATEPAFTPDDGTLCAQPAGTTPTPAGGVCNGSREVYDDEPMHTANFYEIYPGSAPLGDLIYTGNALWAPLRSPSESFAALNGSGDFVYDDVYREEYIEIMDITTPEPSSFALLGTGMLGLAGVVKRRFV